jgi:hypothetical protein
MSSQQLNLSPAPSGCMQKVRLRKPPNRAGRVLAVPQKFSVLFTPTVRKRKLRLWYRKRVKGLSWMATVNGAVGADVLFRGAVLSMEASRPIGLRVCFSDPQLWAAWNSVGDSCNTRFPPTLGAARRTPDASIAAASSGTFRQSGLDYIPPATVGRNGWTTERTGLPRRADQRRRTTYWLARGACT